jgi:predicted nucleic acid-binding protein
VSPAVRANLFDASALVKVHVDEPGSEIVRPYFNGEPTKYTTPFCFYEALNILKSKWLYKGKLAKEQYLAAAFRLTAWYGASSRHISDLDFSGLGVFPDAKRLVERTSLDLSDAFQILSLKQGYFSKLSGDSATILVTADKTLAEAARGEDLRVWYFMEEPPPYG